MPRDKLPGGVRERPGCHVGHHFVLHRPFVGDRRARADRIVPVAVTAPVEPDVHVHGDERQRTRDGVVDRVGPAVRERQREGHAVVGAVPVGQVGGRVKVCHAVGVGAEIGLVLIAHGRAQVGDGARMPMDGPIRRRPDGVHRRELGRHAGIGVHRGAVAVRAVGGVAQVGLRRSRLDVNGVVLDLAVRGDAVVRQPAAGREAEAGEGVDADQRSARRHGERQRVDARHDRLGQENAISAPTAVAVEIDPGVQVAVDRDGHVHRRGLTGDQRRGEDDAVLIVAAVIVVSRRRRVRLPVRIGVDAGAHVDAGDDDVLGSVRSGQRRVRSVRGVAVVPLRRLGAREAEGQVP